MNKMYQDNPDNKPQVKIDDSKKTDHLEDKISRLQRRVDELSLELTSANQLIKRLSSRINSMSSDIARLSNKR